MKICFNTYEDDYAKNDIYRKNFVTKKGGENNRMTIYAGVVSDNNESDIGLNGMCGASFYQDTDPTDPNNKCLKILTKNTIQKLSSTTNIAAKQFVNSPSAYEFEMRHYFESLTWLYATKYFTVEFRNKANASLLSASFEAVTDSISAVIPAASDVLRMKINGAFVDGVELVANRWNTVRFEYYPQREPSAPAHLKVFTSDGGGELSLACDVEVMPEPGTVSRAAIVHSATKIRGVQYLDDLSFSATGAEYSDSTAPTPSPTGKRVYSFEDGIPSDGNFNIEMLLKKNDDRIPLDPAHPTANIKNSPFGHTHDFYEIMLVLTGNATFFTDKEKHQIKPGNIIVVAPGVHHGIVASEGYNLISIAGHFERLGFVEDAYVLEDNIYGEGKKLAELVLYNRFGSEDYVQSLCDAYIKYILLSLEYPVKNTTASIYKIISKMEKNFGNSDISIGKLLDDSGYTKDYIRNEFLAVTKMTPKKYLTNIRMKNAKAMLDLYGDDMGIGEIAERCGILDPSIFSRIFKKHFGVSPTQYREEKTKR